MNIEEIIEVIKDIAHDDLGYLKLYNLIENTSDIGFEYIKESLESQNFQDGIDLILYLEGYKEGRNNATINIT